MQGTPTLIILDKQGHIRLNHFGRMSDMHVGNIIGGLLEGKTHLVNHAEKPKPINDAVSPKCTEDGCLV